MHGQDFRTLLNTLETVDKTVNIAEAWNKWGEFLKEAETKTKTKSKVDNKMFQGTKDSQVRTTKKSEPLTAPDASTRKRTQNVTLKKSVPMPDIAHIDKMIGKSDTDDDWGDLEMNTPQLSYEPTPTLAIGQDTDTDTTDLAINAPTDAETTEIAQRIHDIEWVNMLDLPGNMSQTIRNLGRRVFNAFGEQDFEFIDVVSSITHDEEDLDVISGLVRQFGVPVQKDALIDFQDTIPGYVAHAGVWTFGTQYYMFIKDDMGEYIYTWDNRTTNKLQHTEPMGKDSDRPLLNDINEDIFGNNNLATASYKGYTYDPEIEKDSSDGTSKLIHHIATPEGVSWGVAPSWFKSLSAYDYATPEEFKRAVDEIEADKS
jgi:hypothetical protein